MIEALESDQRDEVFIFKPPIEVTTVHDSGVGQRSKHSRNDA
jgi:hypothetical protein